MNKKENIQQENHDLIPDKNLRSKKITSSRCIS